jgi:hypothetical protein
MSHLETPEHILFYCKEIYVMEQRSESDLNNLHYQLPNNEANLANQIFRNVTNLLLLLAHRCTKADLTWIFDKKYWVLHFLPK